MNQTLQCIVGAVWPLAKQHQITSNICANRPRKASVKTTTPETPKFDACVSVTLQIAATAFTVGLQPTVSMRAHNRKRLEFAPGDSEKFLREDISLHPENCCSYVASGICIFSMNTDEKPIRNNNNKAQPEGEFTFV
ncbi:hypothetical protein CEXT_100131 [Caerostris extrusa]|uniref:Uncharacterized protein n=1 Tax=Caerostris extrusa TaxID=172846 RepID=A0AAV4VD94_CAEEX|nr:hypothetical protein CEXT_100131 [Caerostris extrusa]